MTDLVKSILFCLALGLAVAGAVLIWGGSDSKETVEPDLRGIYTYPGVGLFFLSNYNDSLRVKSPLTLAIFFSAETECLDCLSEVASYKRLDSVFCERGQRVVAITSLEDSTAISAFLELEGLYIPIMVSRLGTRFEEIGIYSKFMPFKILFDSTLTAIYMRGANNSPESQAQFEAAMLWLSEIVYQRRKE